MIKELYFSDSRWHLPEKGQQAHKYQFIDLGKGGMFTNMNDPHVQDDYIEIE